jgi:hypothetical protein
MHPFPVHSRPFRVQLHHTPWSMRVRMIASLGGVLRLVLHHSGPVEPVTADDPADRQRPEVEFSAFAEDCRVSGLVLLDAERLTDMLNEHSELTLVDVVVESLVDGTVSRLPEFTVQRDELLVVEATGPRGNPGRRTRAHRAPVAVKLGPFELRGLVHVTPGASTLEAVRRRRPMVPMTAASIAYEVAGSRVLQVDRTLIFNRECADWIRVIDPELVACPERPFPTLELPLPGPHPRPQLAPSVVRHS